MKTRHTMTATLPMGDPDLGAEVDLTIVYTCLFGAPAQGPTYSSGGQPADPDEIEVVSCKGPGDAYDDMRQSSYDELAQAYLETDEGLEQAFENALADQEDAREYAAESRVDR